MSTDPLTSNPVDTGLIRCVCPSTEDDGFTIQCERCLVWQHAYCVHITHTTIPDHYLCDRCSKRKRPKLSKRIPITKKKLRRLDAPETVPNDNKKKKNSIKVISRYVHSIFREARERWTSTNRWKQHGHQDELEESVPLVCDHGPFVAMDSATLLTKGVLMDTPVSNQGLFANQSISSLRFLMEITGDVFLKSEFKFDPSNDFVILGTPLSHIMFYPSLDLCIDTRQFGNKARYIRRSCHPNAELRNIIMPRSRDDKTIHLGLFARRLIERGQEVTLGWNWQRGHISWKENMSWHHQHKQKKANNPYFHQVIDEEEERKRKAMIKTMLDRFEKEFGACACTNKRRCLIEHLKRQCAPNNNHGRKTLPAVNIKGNSGGGRRKSSIILLKPKPVVALRSDLLNTITNTTKDASDDELLDVEGDIDIDDNVSRPLARNPPPLLNDTMSDDNDDDENADLSSLSSLSSLSVFDESDGEGKQSAKMASSNIPKKAETSIEKVSAPLPRKKLWVRDYLNKHHVEKATEPLDDISIIRNTKEETEQHKTIVKDEHPNDVLGITIVEQSSPEADIADNNSMDQPDVTSMDETTANNNLSEKIIKEEHPEEIHPEIMQIDMMQTDTMQTDTIQTDTIQADTIQADTIQTKPLEKSNSNLFFDTDDELSDASTILLDEEELRTVYSNRRKSTEGEDGSNTALPLSVDTIDIADNSVTADAATTTTTDAATADAATADITNTDDINTTDNVTTTVIDSKNKSAPLSEETKTVVKKKISLQEYLSSRQQQQQEQQQQ
ncbi:MAG: hypothetical protein EXX96DRAFT_88620 [Benjaminiella poitrasii]|nr:MAG: hypothetical protein EXX96DRAFT_88620 [Benjaminiella poitrasii]